MPIARSSSPQPAATNHGTNANTPTQILRMSHPEAIARDERIRTRRQPKEQSARQKRAADGG
jgi:hypothetical protein